MAKKPPSTHAAALRAARARAKANTCPTHGDKYSTTAQYYRCGCPTPHNQEG